MPARNSWRPKTAMVLAAGLGVRMRPLTEHIPKPLVLLNGRTLIDRVLDRLEDAGIERAVVNVHYLAGKLEAHLASRRRPQIQISDERGVLLDTGGGVVRALALLGRDPFLIVNSDSVWIEGRSSNLERLIGAWDGSSMDALMLVTRATHSLGYDGHGDFSMDSISRLERRGARPEAEFVFTGASIAHPRLFEGATEERFSLNSLWDRAILHGRLYGVTLDGIWMHVGTPETVVEAEARMNLEKVG